MKNTIGLWYHIYNMTALLEGGTQCSLSSGGSGGMFSVAHSIIGTARIWEE